MERTRWRSILNTGARITNSDKTFNGYVLQNEKWKWLLFHLLSERMLK